VTCANRANLGGQFAKVDGPGLDKSGGLAMLAPDKILGRTT